MDKISIKLIREQALVVAMAIKELRPSINEDQSHTVCRLVLQECGRKLQKRLIDDKDTYTLNFTIAEAMAYTCLWRNGHFDSLRARWVDRLDRDWLEAILYHVFQELEPKIYNYAE